MKILHIITSLRTGGAEKLMIDLLPRLREKGHEVELCLFDGVDTPFKRDMQPTGITIRELGKNRSVYHPANLIALCKLIRKGRYDIVHTHNTAPQIFAAIASAFSKSKFITTEHNTSNRRRAWKGYVAIDRWMYNRYNTVICISKKAEENLRTYLGKCNTDIYTINNGVNITKYSEAKPSKELEQMAPNSRKIIMVAGFRWEKDQDTLIKALKYLPPNFHLFLVGDGVRRSELESLANAENLTTRVHFLGIRTDVPNLLHSADYIVMSSHFEGLSLSSVEGMSVGKPFLASDVDGLREVVNGAGILFEHQNEKALASEILKLDKSSKLYSSIAQSCKERATQFDISKMVNSYSSLYYTSTTL